MQKDARNEPPIPPEVEDVMRNLVTAIRVVKLYPPNNPIYSQSVKKSLETLGNYLGSSPDYTFGVQKTGFTWQKALIGKDAQLNRTIAQDLFLKGLREVTISSDVTEDELLGLCRALALSPEELSMRSGISSVLWEEGAMHIKVMEAGLDDVITADAEGQTAKDTAGGALKAEKKVTVFDGRTLLLGDVTTDPEGFGASMIELARRTKTQQESLEDRLHTLYQQAGRKVTGEHPDRKDEMFDGLAKSVLALESPHRERLVSGKLYGDLDAELAAGAGPGTEQQVPNLLQEVQAGRYADTWTVQQVATLLKRSAALPVVPPAPLPLPGDIPVQPIPQDLAAIAKDLADYRPEEMAALKATAEAGKESDIIEAAVRTLTHLIPLVKDPRRPGGAEKEIKLFSGVVRQLEDLLAYLLKKNNYELATTIIKTLHMPVDPVFKPRMMDAIKKTATRNVLLSTIQDMRKAPKDSPEYHAAYAYLIALDRKATEILLQLLAEEKDRNARLFLLDLLKDIGKNQTALLGDHLGDDRWFVVRNVVSILAENKSEQAMTYLRRAADHANVQVRQEVIKGLLPIGGKRAASILAYLMNDKEAAVQIEAIRALAELPGIGAEDARPLIVFLQDRPLKKKDQELTIEAIKTMGKIGGKDAADFLQGFLSTKWWKPRQLQQERRTAAQRAILEITRRLGDGGRARR